MPGLLGALAVGIVADGQWGAGWNGVGAKEYLAVTGQGVTGRMAAPELVADPGQLTAQLAGVGAIMVFAFLVGGGVLLAAHLAVRVWHRAGQRMSKDQVRMTSDEGQVTNDS